MEKKLYFLLIIFLSFFAKAQSDCPSAIPVCGNSGLAYTPTGPGLINEELGGCMATDERFTVWYTFTVQTAGTLAFTINPNVSNDDYDFAVYGPNWSCSQIGSPTGQPIRCNYSGTRGQTGLSLTVVHPTVNGVWSGFLNVLPGETYTLVVDNYSRSTNGFTLSWTGTAALSSPFNDPAIQPNPFVEPGPNQDGTIIICDDPTLFDFSTLSAQIINSNPNFSVEYFTNANDALTGNNPITTSIYVNDGDQFHYTIGYTDPNDPNNAANDCKNFGTITFEQGNITTDDDTLIECSNNNTGVALFDLTEADLYFDPNVTTTYYPTLADLNAGTNQITNPTSYTSAEGNVFALVSTSNNCTDISTITLQFYTLIQNMDDTLTTCYIAENEATKGLFDLTTANVTTTGGTTMVYYPTRIDAENQTNSIAAPDAYTSPNSAVYVRITDANGCWKVSKINLIVTPPQYSPVLKDQIICLEDRATLDAGTGYDSYEWSTGDTTQSISGVPIGDYYVDLSYNGCVTRQAVKVYPSSHPVITAVDIKNNTITVSVVGGQAPYKYSLDGIIWQDSNIFTNVPRGVNALYIKDSYDCIPVTMGLFVPNLVNAITPNGDNINDYIDYSSLAFSKEFKFSIFDRYGTKVAEGNKDTGYKWYGKDAQNKDNVPTGTYWYTVVWKNGDNVLLQYSNWILVKNRD